MRIIRFKIKALHGFFDYDIKFNEDLTFLYGENGCGKTTILNILSHVLSGELFRLFNFKFNELSILYKNDNENRNQKESIINILSKSNSKDRILEIRFKENPPVYIKNDSEFSRNEEINHKTSINRSRFFKEYPVGEEIRKNFQYVFLPLNRLYTKNQYLNNTENDFIRFSKLNIEAPLDIKDDMSNVEKIISDSVSQINARLSFENYDFRESVLKSSLEIQTDFNIASFFKYFDESDVTSDLEDTKRRYINLLKKVKTIRNEKQEKDYIQYFDQLIKIVNDNLKFSPKLKKGFSAELIAPYLELIRIKKLIKIQEAMNEKTYKINTPIKEFLKFANRFLRNGEDEKELKIDSFGNVYFTTNYTNENISLKYLSSGEKQIVTLLTYLIFRVERDKFTLFIVDEPELSLHLSWQKKFVSTINEINPNMQLVFATHSPEIVGRYRDKVIKLQRIYKPITKKKVEAEIERAIFYSDEEL